MSDPRDYKLELSSLASDASQSAAEPSPRVGRPYLSVYFACCGVYQRIYRDAEGQFYAGHCPRCARAVRFAVGAGGTSSRFFVAR